MKLDFSDNVYYIMYCNKRESLPLYYCHHESARFPKGYYRCEILHNGFVRVYDTAKGTKVSNFYFNTCFKKPSKLRLFWYKHFSF